MKVDIIKLTYNSTVFYCDYCGKKTTVPYCAYCSKKTTVSIVVKNYCALL